NANPIPRISLRPSLVTVKPPALPAGEAEIAAAAEAAAEGLARELEVVVAATTEDAADVVATAVSVAPDKVFVWIVKGWLDALSELDEKGPVTVVKVSIPT
ncbi:hypothetical protein FRC00_006745, partial [Tulasnella sp. 408]